MTDAQGAGQAGDADIIEDKTYAAELRRQQGDEEKAKKRRIASAEASLKQAKEDVKAAEKNLAIAKKENS